LQFSDEDPATPVPELLCLEAVAFKGLFPAGAPADRSWSVGWK
jgi:hypothetical protein